MCGIVGKLAFDSKPVDEALIRRMCDLILHRGPDDEGIYLDKRVGLGMRRLSIIDVAGGHQPISNEDGTIWIVFNGEIYNFPELRAELEAKGHHFVTHTDTEAVVHLYEELGEACVTRLNGMFAFAIWDGPHQRLMLARDRLGKKPLHYAITRNGLVFASEIAPLLEASGVERRVSLPALYQYLHLWYVPGPLTMFEGILKLPSAHTLICEHNQVRIRRYWDLDFAPKRNLSRAEWSEQIMGVMQDAVRIRMISDVPLGAFLSGGIDSSAVVALMNRNSNRPIKTFSIGFENEAYNELPYARQVAKHLGTEHYDEIVRPDALQLLPKLLWHFGEPFGDDSCIPTYYLSQLARQHVTVALSGDGGDESFGGYPRVAQYLAFSPFRSLRGLLSTEVKGILSQPNPLAAALAPVRWRDFWGELTYRVREIAEPMERYSHAWICWKDGLSHPLTSTAQRAISGQPFGPLDSAWHRARKWNGADRLFYLELMTYLPDDLEVKMDIASMAVSLEVRAPFLDYRLVELAASMPPDLKLLDNQTKVLLRETVRPLMPKAINERGKQGFSMPINAWISGSLKSFVEDLLLDGTARNRGFFRAGLIEEMIRKHMTGQRDYSRHIWLMMVFEMWARIFLDGTWHPEPPAA